MEKDMTIRIDVTLTFFGLSCMCTIIENNAFLLCNITILCILPKNAQSSLFFLWFLLFICSLFITFHLFIWFHFCSCHFAVAFLFFSYCEPLCVSVCVYESVYVCVCVRPLYLGQFKMWWFFFCFLKATQWSKV